MSSLLSILLLPPPPASTLFPYTTLFRSSPRTSPTPRRSCAPRVRASCPARSSTSPADRRTDVTSSDESVQGLDLGALRAWLRSEEHTSELQSRRDLVCRLLLEKKKEKST